MNKMVDILYRHNLGAQDDASFALFADYLNTRVIATVCSGVTFKTLNFSAWLAGILKNESE